MSVTPAEPFRLQGPVLFVGSIVVWYLLQDNVNTSARPSHSASTRPVKPPPPSFSSGGTSRGRAICDSGPNTPTRVRRVAFHALQSPPNTPTLKGNNTSPISRAPKDTSQQPLFASPVAMLNAVTPSPVENAALCFPPTVRSPLGASADQSVAITPVEGCCTSTPTVDYIIPPASICSSRSSTKRGDISSELSLAIDVKLDCDSAVPSQGESAGESSLGAVDVSDIALLSKAAAEHEEKGELVEAEDLYQQCSEAYLIRVGDNHPDTLACQADLAGVYELQERYDEAENLLLNCMEKYISLYGELNAEVLACLDDLAGIYDCQHKFEAAEAAYLKCIQQRKVVLGPSHSHTVAAMNNLGCLYERRERYSEAETLYQECALYSQEEFGETHTVTVTYIYNLAGLYETEMKFPQAEDTYVSLLAKMKDELGPTHEDTLLCMSKLASLYKIQAKLDLSETLFTFCLQERRKVLASWDMRIIKDMHSLAEINAAQYRYDIAESMYADAYKCLEMKHGLSHPHTLAGLEALALFYESMGDYTNAELYYLRRMDGVNALYADSNDAVIVEELLNLTEFYKSKEMNEFDII